MREDLLFFGVWQKADVAVTDGKVEIVVKPEKTKRVDQLTNIHACNS